MSEFGTALKQIRAELNLPQSELAGRIGSTQRHVSFLETGRSAPTKMMLWRLANELALSAGQRAALYEASGLKNPYKRREVTSDEVVEALNLIENRVLANWPFPAMVLDENWTIIRTNRPASIMFDAMIGAANAPYNMYELMLSDRFRDAITNWEVAGSAVYARLQSAATRSRVLRDLLDHARTKGIFDGLNEKLGAQDEIPVFVPVEMRLPTGAHVRFSSLLGHLASVHDALVAGFEIEMLVPLDAESETVVRQTFAG